MSESKKPTVLPKLRIPGPELAQGALALLLVFLIGLSPLPKTWALLGSTLLGSLLPMIFMRACLRTRGLGLDRFYEGAFFHSATPLLLLDQNNRLLSMNLACQTLLGLVEAPKTGTELKTLLPEAWLAHFSPSISHAWSEEVRLDGPAEPKSILLSSSRVERLGIELGTVTACIDLSEQKAMERRQLELLHRNEAYVQHLIDVIPHPVYVRDAQGCYLMTNKAFSALQALGAADVTTPGLQEEDHAVLAGEPVLKEIEYPTAPGEKLRSVLVSKGACEAPDGQAVIVGAHFDVSRWREAELELEAALARELERGESYQNYIQRLIDVLPYPFYVKDSYSRCLLGNKAFADLQGCQGSELTGRVTTLHMDPTQATAIHKEDAEAFAGREILKEEFAMRFATDKEARYRMISKGACLDADGEAVVVCAFIDVTDWRLAEARWREAKREADRANETMNLFFANMSHELRTPMHAILSFARLGQEKTQGELSKAREHGYFERVVKSGERLLNLLNNLLNLARLEDGRALSAPRRMDLEAIAQDSLSEFSALMDSRRITVDFRCEGPPLTLGDHGLMGQVFRNLLSNAIKFSPPGGRLRLRMGSTLLEDKHTGALQPAAEVRLSDEGPGIPVDELEAIFDRFVQSSKTQPDTGGTGLGLAICRKIMQLHKGEIFATSPDEGGAEFVLRLPAQSEAA